MSFTTGIYNINDVSAVVNGWTIQAPATDKPFEIVRTTPEDWKMKVGSKGETTFVFQPDKSGKMMVRIKQNSVDDAKQLHSLKEAGTIFPCEFNNSVTKEKAYSTFCMVGTIAPIQFNSADEAELEFEIIAASITQTRGK